MRSILLCFCLAGAVFTAAPVSVQSALPKTKIHKPVAPAAKGCKSASDCSCPQAPRCV